MFYLLAHRGKTSAFAARAMREPREAEHCCPKTHLIATPPAVTRSHLAGLFENGKKLPPPAAQPGWLCGHLAACAKRKQSTRLEGFAQALPFANARFVWKGARAWFFGNCRMGFVKPNVRAKLAPTV